MFIQGPAERRIPIAIGDGDERVPQCLEIEAQRYGLNRGAGIFESECGRARDAVDLGLGMTV